MTPDDIRLIYTARGESFAFETTLSGRGHARSTLLWQERGIV